MNWREYFESKRGTGVLATADKEGRVDVAVYARPHVMDDGSLAFIMADRLTHHNLQSNDHAAYLFKENGEGYSGRRLILKKLREETDTELLHTLRRRSDPCPEAPKKPLFLVFFKIEKELPLVGSGE